MAETPEHPNAPTLAASIALWRREDAAWCRQIRRYVEQAAVC